MPTIHDYEAQVKIEDAEPIYVGPDAIVVLREEASRQANEWLRDVNDMWGDLDDTDVDVLKDVEYKLARVQAAVSALKYLAPVAEEEG